MPTYNERLQKNNSELANIKQTIDNLPPAGGVGEKIKESDYNALVDSGQIDPLKIYIVIPDKEWVG